MTAMNYGEIFQRIRKARKVSLKEMEDIVPRRTLTRYEKGETDFPISKLEALLQRLDFSLDDFYHATLDKKIYPRYGKVFKRLREQRGFSLQDFSDIPVTSHQIKLFEASIIMLGFDMIYAMLQEMDVSLQDYSFLLNKGAEEPFGALLQEIDCAYYKGDKAVLQKFYLETKECRRFLLLSLSVKVLLEEISCEEIRELEGFFMTVDLWTNYELFVFQHTAYLLSSSNLKLICTDILSLKYFFEDRFFCQRRLALAGLKIALSRIKRKKSIAARYFLDFSKEFLQESDELTKTTYHFVESLYSYRETGEEKYKLIMQEVCDMSLKQNGLMKEWYQENYKKLIK